MYEFDRRSRPRADTSIEEFTNLGHRATLSEVEGELLKLLGAQPGTRVVITSSREEALATALRGLITRHPNLPLQLDEASPRTWKGSAHQLVGGKGTSANFGESAIHAIVWADYETGEIRPIKDCEGPIILDLGWAPGRVQWADIPPADISIIAGASIGGPKASAALVLAPGIGIDPLIHGGSEQYGLRGGEIDDLVIWRLAGALHHLKASTEATQQEAIRKVTAFAIPELKNVGLELIETEYQLVPGQWMMRIPGISASALAIACEARGAFISPAASCAGEADHGPAALEARGWSPEEALEVILFTLDHQTRQEDLKKGIEIIENEIKRLAGN